MVGEEDKAPAKVLVIDDDPDVVRVVRLILKIRGYEVLEALSGTSGFFIAKRERPDVILLDIMMPDIDGFEVMRKLKLDAETAEIPVVFVSARTGKEHVDRGLSLGAQGYITKPFRPEALAEKIKELLA